MSYYCHKKSISLFFLSQFKFNLENFYKLKDPQTDLIFEEIIGHLLTMFALLVKAQV